MNGQALTANEPDEDEKEQKDDDEGSSARQFVILLVYRRLAHLRVRLLSLQLQLLVSLSRTQLQTE